ncbi:MAG: glycosyltransferase [Verrucomicrobiota bacterium]|nr:glycosyltransferase [Verrucomicrobiota bacterium]
MKVLIFAHVPPPHHGQSYLVQLLLEAFGGDHSKGEGITNHYGIECYHVDARFSQGMEDIGRFRIGKLIQLFGYCFQAIRLGIRHQIDTFYYIPAPALKNAIRRDWLIMLLCRPFFKYVVLHWHAAGLGGWMQKEASGIEKALTMRALGKARLSIVTAKFSMTEGEAFFSKETKVVLNGIPDPCPNFDQEVLPLRQQRMAMIKETLLNGGNSETMIQVGYLGLCSRDKGLLDTVKGIALANEQLRALHSPFRMQFKVAGKFLNDIEKMEYDQLVAELHLEGMVQHVGFLYGEEKLRFFKGLDLFCFPTFYFAESFGLILLEAMAWGVPVVTTKWRSIPEVLPAGYGGLVDICAPKQIASSLIRMMSQDVGRDLRKHFLQNYFIERHFAGMAAALKSIEAK